MHRNLTTLGNVFERVDALSQGCRDEFVRVKEISFESLEKVEIAGETHKLKPIAQRSMCYRLGIPYQYLAKCPHDLQRENMKYWIEKEKNEELFFRFENTEVRRYSPRNTSRWTTLRFWKGWIPSDTNPRPRSSAVWTANLCR